MSFGIIKSCLFISFTASEGIPISRGYGYFYYKSNRKTKDYTKAYTVKRNPGYNTVQSVSRFLSGEKIPKIVIAANTRLWYLSTDARIRKPGVEIPTGSRYIPSVAYDYLMWKIMPYSDFTLKKVKEDLGIAVIEQRGLFAHISETALSDALLNILRYNVPLATAIGTEKARSEMIVVNILLEVKRMLDEKISLFSGIHFDVDKNKNLNGFCDFIISRSQEQFYLSAPVIAIVESKDDKTTSGLGQCIAELYAARVFNQTEGQAVPALYGAITTGSHWRFLTFRDNTATIDMDEYPIETPGKIVAILIAMANQTV